MADFVTRDLPPRSTPPGYCGSGRPGEIASDAVAAGDNNGSLLAARRYPVLAYCETCGRLFYTASSAGKFCDVPTCRGYLRHIDRGRNRV